MEDQTFLQCHDISQGKIVTLKQKECKLSNEMNLLPILQVNAWTHNDKKTQQTLLDLERNLDWGESPLKTVASRQTLILKIYQ